VKVFFIFATTTRPTPGPTQSHMQVVPKALTPAVKRLGREADYSPPSTAAVTNAWSYTPIPPVRLRGVVLS